MGDHRVERERPDRADRQLTPATAAGGERGTGAFGTSFGFLVFLIFLLFGVQAIFGLYARTTVTAITQDLARRAASEGILDAGDPRLRAYEAEARRRLGRYGDRATFAAAVEDVDRDGRPDTITIRAEADLPDLVPSRLGGSGAGRFTRTVHARIETFQVAP